MRYITDSKCSTNETKYGLLTRSSCSQGRYNDEIYYQIRNCKTNETKYELLTRLSCSHKYKNKHKHRHTQNTNRLKTKTDKKHAPGRAVMSSALDDDDESALSASGAGDAP